MTVQRHRKPDATARVRHAVLGVTRYKRQAEPEKPAVAAEPAKPAERGPMKVGQTAISKSGRATITPKHKPAAEPFKPYEPAPGVLPTGQKAMAMDSALSSWAQESYSLGWAAANPYYGAFAEGMTFLGYAYLSELTQRPEYRKISERIAVEMTRKWIRITVADDDDGKADKKKQTALLTKVKKIEKELKRLKVRDAFRTIAEQDGWFGRAHLYLDTGSTDDVAELRTPIGNGDDDVSKAKFSGKKGFLKAVRTVEAIWCYPQWYNSIDPLSGGWYKPALWYAQAKEVHVSRLLLFVGREVPDILKPAYAFGGLSMSQMAKPYVDNWLRTRQAVTDLVESFSVSGIYTNMAQVLSGGDGEDVLGRVDLFNNTRSNRGSMVLDKETEEFFNISTPLGTLDALQAQAQEQMSSVSGIPLVILLGITPKGLNASSEGEIRVFYDFIHAYQEALFREHLTTVLNFVQLSLFGAVDDRIDFEFEPLWSLDEKGQAEVDKIKAETGVVLVDGGIVSQEEERKRIASDPDTPYVGIDPDDVPDLAQEEEDGLMPRGRGGGFGGGDEGGEPDDDGPAPHSSRRQAQDAAFNEADHPREKDGKFGSGGTGGSGAKKVEVTGTGPKKLEQLPASKMRGYTEKELDWEYDVEYLKYSKGAFPDAFSSREDFQKKVDAAPLVHLTDDELKRLGNSMAYAGKGRGEKWVHDTFSHRRDSKRIIAELKEGKTSPPIILRDGKRMRLMAGQTRLATGLALNMVVPAKVVDVSKKQAQDEKPWDESKHPRAPDGKFGHGSGGGTATKEAPAKKKPTAFGGLYKSTGQGEKADYQATVKYVLANSAKHGSHYRNLLKNLIDNGGKFGASETEIEGLKDQLKQAYLNAADKLEIAGETEKAVKAINKAYAVIGKPVPFKIDLGGKPPAAEPEKKAEPAKKDLSPSDFEWAANEKFMSNTAKMGKMTPIVSAKEKIKAMAQTGSPIDVAKKLLTEAEHEAVKADYHGSVEKMLASAKNHVAAAKTQAEAAKAAKEAAAKEAKEFEDSLNSPEAKEHYAALEGIMSGSATSAIKAAQSKLKQTGYDKYLTPTEGAQVMAYSGSYYREVNKQLRAGVMTEKQWMFAEALNAALTKMPSHDGVTYRGTTLSAQELAQYKPGMIVNEMGFMSTSKSNPFGGNTKFEVHGKTGKDIQKLSHYHSEAEVLFRAGTKFRVKEKKGNTIVLEEVTFGTK